MLTVIIFILILGLLIFVHEFGHFIVARRNGAIAEEFGFGFPPRIFGVYLDKNRKRKIVWGSKQVESSDTIYSLNWIPLGGFVKIVGEDGEAKDNPKSFASKSPFVRIKILAAGVTMNILLAFGLLSAVYFIGIPQAVEDSASGNFQNEKIQIMETISGSPAEKMDIKVGDQVVGARENGKLISFSSVEQVQNYISDHKGKEIKLDMKRGDESLILTGIPRTDFPANEGALGISLVKTAQVSYSWYESIWRGAKMTVELAWMIVVAFGSLLWKLISGQSVGMDVSGPVGIAVLTGQVAKLGIVYIMQFTAMLSINLAIINILPIPALDGGRILFVMVEKFKGKPVSQKLEQRAHNIGFALLIALMAIVTFRDVAKLEVLDKLKNFLGG